MTPKGRPYRVEGQKTGSQAWHTLGVYSALAPMGAMRQALADTPVVSGFVSLRTRLVKRVLIPKS